MIIMTSSSSFLNFGGVAMILQHTPYLQRKNTRKFLGRSHKPRDLSNMETNRITCGQPKSEKEDNIGRDPLSVLCNVWLRHFSRPVQLPDNPPKLEGPPSGPLVKCEPSPLLLDRPSQSLLHPSACPTRSMPTTAGTSTCCSTTVSPVRIILSYFVGLSSGHKRLVAVRLLVAVSGIRRSRFRIRQLKVSNGIVLPSSLSYRDWVAPASCKSTSGLISMSPQAKIRLRKLDRASSFNVWAP